MQFLRGVWRILHPDWRKLLLFGVLIAIGAGAMIQASVFSEVSPKPPLYDALRPFPLWSLWVYLVAPLILLNLPFQLFGVDLFEGGWVFRAANLIYFYVLASVGVSLVDWLRSIPDAPQRS